MKLFLILFVVFLSCAISTTSDCPVIPGTVRKVVSGSDLQVDVLDSFTLSTVEVTGKATGFAGYSDTLKTGVLVLTLPSTGVLINDELNIRSALSSFSVRVRPISLISNPVITFSSTWDNQETIRAQYGMATDVYNAQNCGIKQRINDMASKLLGHTLSPLGVLTDHMVLARYGFLTSIELARRGSNTIAIFAISAADDTAAIDSNALTTGSAHAGAADSVNTTCEQVYYQPAMSVDVIFFADSSPTLLPYRYALAGYVDTLFNGLDVAGISWRVSVIFDKQSTPKFVASSQGAANALRTTAPTSGNDKISSDMVAIIFVGDTDQFSSSNDATAYFQQLVGSRPIVYGGVLCPEGLRCRTWKTDNTLTRTLLQSSHGTVGWMRPTWSMEPFMSAFALDIAFAASTTQLSMFAITSTVQISLPSSSTKGKCNWIDVPVSTTCGFMVRGSKVAFFDKCVPNKAVTFSAAYSYFVGEKACVPSPEVCDGKDNNCDGHIDEGFDQDGDGYTTCGGDCNDNDATVHPNAVEICNKIDDNCNGLVDEGCPDFPDKPYTVIAMYYQDCSIGKTTFTWNVSTSQSILSTFSVPLDPTWSVFYSDPPNAQLQDKQWVWATPVGDSQLFTLTLDGIYSSGLINVIITGSIPAMISSTGPTQLNTISTAPSSPPTTLTFEAKIRDLRPDHPDVERLIITEPGLVEPSLGADGYPILTAGFHSTITSGDTFYTWFHDSTAQTPLNLQSKVIIQNFLFKITGTASPFYALYQPNPNPFFPIDGEGWDTGKTPGTSNYYFTVELTIPFTYHTGDYVQVTSDDDVWVFVDGKLLIDNGGVHPALMAMGSIDTFKFEVGTTHTLRIFFVERHMVASVFEIIVPSGAWQCEHRDFCGNCTTSVCPDDQQSDSDGDQVIDCYDVCPNDPTRWDASIPAVCPCGQGGDRDGDGIPDCLDLCPDDPLKKLPGQCGCGVPETGDSDNDGLLDCVDPCPLIPYPTCECGAGWPDSDGDGRPDCMDACPYDPNKISPGICGCGFSDVDTDKDGVPDCNDDCPTDPLKSTPGICGCGVSDNVDSDSDGTPDCIDNCPKDKLKTQPGICGCGVSDIDTDGDGVPDCNDLCPLDPNKVEPGICGCGTPDTDSDGDQTPDCNDGCINDPLKTDPGVCGCNIPEDDSDGDNTPDCIDQCDNDPNKIQIGICGCGISDVDTDGDGVPDCNDTCPSDPLKTVPGACGCNVPDIDSDNDGTLDCFDACPDDPLKTDPGLCGCGNTDVDTDGDGYICDDECPDNPDLHIAGACGCNASAYVDSDNDGVNDCYDQCPLNPNKTAPGVCGCDIPDSDQDADGFLTCQDECPMNPYKQFSGLCGCELQDYDPCSAACPVGSLKVTPGQCGCDVADIDNDHDGYASCIDQCDNDPLKTAPGLCGCGVPDVDTDGDGVVDCLDQCPTDPNKIEPGVCGCGVRDIDSDEDGTFDCNDLCTNDPNKIAPGVCGCGVPDTDSDGDGTPDCNDLCLNDPNKVLPGVCGCGLSDKDSDGDGTPDCDDLCPTDPNKIAPGACGCGNPDDDSDGDGTPDCNDMCPLDPNKVDPGVCGCGCPDTDSDGDGTPDCVDMCPLDPNKVIPGVCGCGNPDVYSDGDEYPDCIDECPYNPDLQYPTVCGCSSDVDSDGDQVPDCLDDCPADPNKVTIDPDKCGCGYPDVDSDGDAYYDFCQDQCPYDPLKSEPGVCGCGVPDTDTDGDGTPDCIDGCPNDPLKNVPGICGCGVVDSTVDSDNDGWPDCVDQCPGQMDTDYDLDGFHAPCNDLCDFDPLKVAPGVCGCGVPDTDMDHDGYPACIDKCDNNPNYIGLDVVLPCNNSCLQIFTMCPPVATYKCYGYCFNDAINYPDPCMTCPAEPLVVTRSETKPSIVTASVEPEKKAVPMKIVSCVDDSDGDGTPDCYDFCRYSPLKIYAGVCGCYVPDRDRDGDQVPDCVDSCPDDPLKVVPLFCGCGVLDVDTDGDRIPDCWDGCPLDPKKVVPGACGCGSLEAQDGGDSDKDGAPDCVDRCPLDPLKNVTGECGCGVSEIDTDGDQQPDCVDRCPFDPHKISEGVCGCGVPDVDSDNDGTRDCFDECPFDPLSTVKSSCGCGYDEFQCVEPVRSSEVWTSGLNSAVIVIVTVAAVIAVGLVIGAVIIPFAIIRHRNGSRASATAQTTGDISVDEAASWKRPVLWKAGTISSDSAEVQNDE